MQSLLIALDGQCLEKYCVVTMAQWISGGCVIIGHSLPPVVTLGSQDRSPQSRFYQLAEFKGG